MEKEIENVTLLVLQIEKNVQKHVRETCIIQTCCIEAYCMHCSQDKENDKRTQRNLSSFIFCFSNKSWELKYLRSFNSHSLLIEFDQMHSRLQDEIALFEECAYKEILVEIKRICNFVKTCSIRIPFYEKLGIPKPI